MSNLQFVVDKIESSYQLIYLLKEFHIRMSMTQNMFESRLNFFNKEYNVQWEKIRKKEDDWLDYYSKHNYHYFENDYIVFWNEIALNAAFSRTISLIQSTNEQYKKLIKKLDKIIINNEKINEKRNLKQIRSILIDFKTSTNKLYEGMINCSLTNPFWKQINSDECNTAWIILQYIDNLCKVFDIYYQNNVKNVKDINDVIEKYVEDIMSDD